MWNKATQSEVPGASPTQESRIPAAPYPSGGTRPSSPAARVLACLGSTIKIKGEISSDEDLQIDGKVEGPIAVHGHRLIIGRTAQLSSEISAGEAIVYGNVAGNLHARDRVEIKKDGELIGDIRTARVSIEEGAYFKGRIEIERSKPPVQGDRDTAAEEVLVGASTN